MSRKQIKKDYYIEYTDKKTKKSKTTLIMGIDKKEAMKQFLYFYDDEIKPKSVIWARKLDKISTPYQKLNGDIKKISPVKKAKRKRKK